MTASSEILSKNTDNIRLPELNMTGFTTGFTRILCNELAQNRLFHNNLDKITGLLQMVMTLN